MGDNFFEPKEVTVAAGTTIRWRNLGKVDHNVVPRGDSWISPILKPDQVYERAFDTPGRYLYLCAFHDGMEGVIVVAPS